MIVCDMYHYAKLSCLNMISGLFFLLSGSSANKSMVYKPSLLQLSYVYNTILFIVKFNCQNVKQIIKN